VRNKSKLVMAAALSLVLVLGISSVATPIQPQIPTRILEKSISPMSHWDSGKSQIYCEIQNDVDNPSYFFNHFDSDTIASFAVYMDPAQCGGSPYPFRVTDVHLYLYDPGEYEWPVNLTIKLKNSDQQGSACSGPQELLHSEDFSIPGDSAFPVKMNLTLSDAYCVYQPFFLEIAYADPHDPLHPHPSLLMDDTLDVPDTCDNWATYLGEYYEWYDFWEYPPTGDAIIRATGYTESPDCADLWYWKPDKPTQDHPAPSGMPDFDQNQEDWVGYCGPAAAANCLWWFNAVPEGWNPPQLIDTLARYFHTHPPYYTFVDSMEIGLSQYFQDYGFALQESTFQMPNFFEMEDSLKKCQDIILLLGFWFYDESGQQWYREGGHFVTMAGVCSESLKIAVSDPDKDAAEGGWPGRVRPVEHPPHPGDPLVHNNPSYVSQDMYQSTLESPNPSPGNPNWEIDYQWQPGKFTGMNVPEEFIPYSRPAPEGAKDLYVTEVEYAVMICPTTSAVEDEEGGGSTPRFFELDQNYPNPFNSQTIIKFNLRRPAEVTLTIFNVLGQRVRKLAAERMSAGAHTIAWDGKDEKGSDVSSGIYFYRLKAGEQSQTKRLVLLK
jgi:hypothetical protein